MIILEDDLTLPLDFSKNLSIYLSHLPKDYDISQIYLSDIKEITNYAQNQKINNYVKTGYPQNGTVAYIISRKGAKKITN